MRSVEWMRWVAVAALAAVAVGCKKGGEEAPSTTAETTAAPAPAPEAPAAAPAPTTTAGPVPANLPAGVTADMINQGREIFHGPGNCYTCHGMDAKGTTLAPDLTDKVYINIDGNDYNQYVTLVTNGVPQPKQHPAPMPPKGGSNITDDQVKAVAAYEWALSHGGTP
ncbi:MAG TPA: c-type cytochrome [Longimicrobiales bacterium]|nr:c-type cytochrome [Longimicrobiales bacterium]